MPRRRRRSFGKAILTKFEKNKKKKESFILTFSDGETKNLGVPELNEYIPDEHREAIMKVIRSGGVNSWSLISPKKQWPPEPKVTVYDDGRIQVGNLIIDPKFRKDLLQELDTKTLLKVFQKIHKTAFPKRRIGITKPKKYLKNFKLSLEPELKNPISNMGELLDQQKQEAENKKITVLDFGTVPNDFVDYNQMSYIPGSNNGTWGAGMHRALFPKSMGGALGYRGHPLPNAFQHPAAVMEVPYAGHAFGHSFGQGPADFGDVSQDTVYSLTPGSSTTESGWGFNQLHFGGRGEAMKLHHELGISLKDAWKIVKGDTSSGIRKIRSPKKRSPRKSRRSRKPCKSHQYRHPGTKRCRNLLRGSNVRKNVRYRRSKRRSRAKKWPTVKSRPRRPAPSPPRRSRPRRLAPSPPLIDMFTTLSPPRPVRSKRRSVKKWPTVKPGRRAPLIPERPAAYKKSKSKSKYKRKPCQQGFYRHPKTHRCRKLGIQSRTKMMKGLSHVKQKQNRSNAKRAMKLHHQDGYTLKEAWALVKSGR